MSDKEKLKYARAQFAYLAAKAQRLNQDSFDLMLETRRIAESFGATSMLPKVVEEVERAHFEKWAPKAAALEKRTKK